MITKKEKIKLLDSLKEQVQKAQEIILVDFTGLSVAQMEKLRNQLREIKASLQVIPKALAKRLWSNLDHQGSVALVCLQKDADAILPCNVLDNFAQESDNLQILQGWLEEEKMEPATVRKLSQLQSREQAMKKITGLIKTPLNKLILCLKSQTKNK